MKLTEEQYQGYARRHAAWVRQQRLEAVQSSRRAVAEHELNAYVNEIHLDAPPGFAFDVWGDRELKPIAECAKPPGATG